MNSTQFYEATKEYLNRPNTTVDTFALWVRAVEGELNRALRDHPRNRRHVQHTQAANSFLLPLPTDMAQLITLHANGIIYKQFPPDALDEANAHGHAYIVLGDAITLVPAPGVDTIFNLEYTAFLNPLVNGLDENWVSKYFPDVFLYGVLKEAAAYLKDDARFQLWQGEYGRRVEELIAQGWNQNISLAPTVIAK